MMNIQQLKELFLIKEDKPTKTDIKKYTVSPYENDSRLYWVLFKTAEESKLFDYLTSSMDYKAKEILFGINSELETPEGLNEMYFSSNGRIPFILKKLDDKCILSDGKIKRELDVYISNIDTENKELLHSLYLKIRGKLT